MLQGMHELVFKSPHIGSRQMPKDEGAAEQDDDHKRVHKRSARAVESACRPSAANALTPQRREGPDEGNIWTAPYQKRRHNHHQEDVLQHVRREKLICSLVERRAKREEKEQHTRRERSDAPAVEDALGAGFVVEAPDAHRIEYAR